MPLRKCLTAGPSRSKSGKHIWYYFCTNKGHKRANLNAKRLHGQFEELMDTLSLDEVQIAYMQERIEGRINEKKQVRTDELDSAKRSLQSVKQKLEKLEEKYVLDEISREAYMRMYTEWQEERMLYDGKVASLTFPQGTAMERFRKHLGKLKDFALLYSKGTVHQQHVERS